MNPYNIALDEIEINYSKILEINKINVVSNFLKLTYNEIEKIISNYKIGSESESNNLIEFLDDVLRVNIQLLRRSKEKLKEETNNLLPEFYHFFTNLITAINLKKINSEDFEIQLINSIQSLLEKDEISSKEKIFKSFYELMNTQLNQVFFSREATNFKNLFSCLSSLIHYLDYFSNETTGSLLKILFLGIDDKIKNNPIFQTEEIINNFFNTLKMAAFHLNIFSQEGKIELIDIIKNQLHLCKNSENCKIKNTQTTAFETLDLIANYNPLDIKSFDKIKDILLGFCITKEDLENRALDFLKKSLAKQNITLQDECANGNSTTVPSFDPATSKHESEKNLAIENHPLEFAGAIGHGVLSGIINGSIQYFSNKNSASRQNNFTRLVIICTGLLANATLAATFPVILSEIEKLYIGNNDEEAERLLNTLYNQALPTFFTSIGLGVALQLVKQYTEILSQSPKIKSFIQNIIPVMGTSVSLISKPLPTLTQLATASASSILTYISLNRLSPVKNRQPDIETNNNTGVRYDAANDKTDITTNGKVVSENEAKMTYQFICLPELNQVKKCSSETLGKLNTLIETCQAAILDQKKQINDSNSPDVSVALNKSIKDYDHILSIVKDQFTLANKLQEELKDDMHLKACEIYSSDQKKEFNAAMEKLGNVFKLMDINFESLQGKLKEAIGYTDAASGSFSNTVKNQLNELTQTVKFASSKVSIYKARYSNAEAIEKTEKRCKKQVNLEYFNVREKNDIAVGNKIANNGNFNGNRNTFAFSNDSASDLSSTSLFFDESKQHLRGSGDSAYNPIDLQQTAPLLNRMSS